MTEDFNDGAQSQPLKAGVQRDGFLVWPVRFGEPQPKPTISAEDLEAWRTDMRARPPEPPQKKPHTRVDGAWTTPQEWNRP